MTVDRLQVRGLDHIVLRTPDIERSLQFYCGVLGLQGERVEAWRDGRAPFPSARIDERTIIDLVAASRDGTNLDHLCLVVAPLDFDELSASGALRVVEGPVPRWGARGLATSIYIEDPDGNIVELRYYDA
jgi:catechol 2,3-dioxygenase-like lactoylglutathione lyase family enzyme